MSDEAESTDDKARISFPDERDWALVQLLKLVNKTDLELGITLTVGGSVISGTLISGKNYFKEVAEGFRSGNGHEETKNAVAMYYEHFGELVYKEAEGEEDPDAPDPEPGFIHLRRARHVTLDGTFPVEGSLWRGRLAAIDGFSFGEVTVTRS